MLFTKSVKKNDQIKWWGVGSKFFLLMLNKKCKIGAALHPRSLKSRAAATMDRRPKIVLGGSKRKRGNFCHYQSFSTIFADFFCHLLSFRAIFCCFLPFCTNFSHLAQFSAILCRFPRKGASPGISILTSYGVNPHFVKLPIFSEFMENSAKFVKNSGLTKWTQNLR